MPRLPRLPRFGLTFALPASTSKMLGLQVCVTRIYRLEKPFYSLSLRLLFSFLGNFFRLYESHDSSSLRLTRNTDFKRITGFCTKPQESPKAPTSKFLLVFQLQTRWLPRNRAPWNQNPEERAWQDPLHHPCRTAQSPSSCSPSFCPCAILVACFQSRWAFCVGPGAPRSSDLLTDIAWEERVCHVNCDPPVDSSRTRPRQVLASGKNDP